MVERPITVVVPCFNEAGRLRLTEFRNYAATHPDVRFLFVDDGSTDSTRRLLAIEARNHPDSAMLLPLEKNAGKGEAVRLGMLKAIEEGTRFVAYWDADLATPLEEMTRMVECLGKGPEISCVMGARVRLLGRNIQRKAVRHYLGRIFASAASWVLRIPVYDTQCGAKLFRVTDDLQSALARPFRSRWIFDVELLARLSELYGNDAEKRMVEYPLRTWQDIGGSRLRAKDFFRAAFNLLELWLRREGHLGLKRLGKPHVE
jgi:glycosyltransferase involved in cell wall biosynthesis